MHTNVSLCEMNGQQQQQLHEIWQSEGCEGRHGENEILPFPMFYVVYEVRK